MSAGASPLQGHLVALILPGETWGDVFTSHAEWAVTALDEIPPEDHVRVARQLCLLYAATVEGAPPQIDDLVTEMRELRDAACEMLGHTPDNQDTQLAARFVLRHETIQSIVRKLAALAGYSLLPRDE